ncbi:hypothetical protein DPMN_085700 [Dreissena polymorpha]|uniref:Uncharacterized protein n=1 Tax=Dreissena polymorpha TaxID=45954 RepID=A0A9D4BD33_DREPO|nr:hypothetical protein DPMN_085700 [Dreissena polymorpha]
MGMGVHLFASRSSFSSDGLDGDHTPNQASFLRLRVAIRVFLWSNKCSCHVLDVLKSAWIFSQPYIRIEPTRDDL